MAMLLGLGYMELLIIILVGILFIGAPLTIAIVAIAISKRNSRAAAGGNLRPCPDCNRMVSMLAESCPQCGRPLKAT